MYCTPEDVYREAGITLSEVNEEDIKGHIESAEVEVDRLTNTTWWHVESSGSVSSATDNTITVTDNTFSVNEYENSFLWIYSGTGLNQMLRITSNTKDTITLEDDWTTNPDDTSKYRVVHTAQDPRVTEKRSGDSTNLLYVDHYPIVKVISVDVDGTSATVSTLLLDEVCGEIDLQDDAAVNYWKEGNQKNTIVYWFGVYKTIFSKLIRDLTACYAALAALNQQMGGTHNIPSTYSLPEGSVSVGQAYVNIKGTIDVLNKRIANLETKAPKYHSFH